MASFYKHGRSWTVTWHIRGQRRRYIYGIKTAKLAAAAASNKSTEEQLAKAELHRPDDFADSVRSAETMPLDDLVDLFVRSLKAKGRNAQHIGQTAAQIRRLLKLGTARFIAEIDAGRIQAAARSLMEKEGRAPRTANAAIKAIRAFTAWLFATRRTRYDLLHGQLESFNEQFDIRRQRRELSQMEVDWLLTTTAAGKDFRSRRCGISPADRAQFYATGLGTGFRQRALLSLTPESFHVGENIMRPFIRLGAAHNKNGKDRDQPIRRDLAESLRAWLAGKPAHRPVWDATPHASLARRFRLDIEAARKAWIAASASPEQREHRERSNTLKYVYHDGQRNIFADFHSLRHTGISLVVRHAGLKVGQAWADHSTPVLTAKYAHLDLVDESKALEALPSSTPQSHEAHKRKKA